MKKKLVFLSTLLAIGVGSSIGLNNSNVLSVGDDATRTAYRLDKIINPSQTREIECPFCNRLNYVSNNIDITASQTRCEYCDKRLDGSPDYDRSGNGELHGTVRWKDDKGNVHNARDCMVGFINQANNILATTYVDVNGNFSITINNTTGTAKSWTGKLRIYAGDLSNVDVKDANDSAYYVETGYTTILSGYPSYNANSDFNSVLTIDMSTTFGKAFQVGQAVMFARDFAKDMINRTPNFVNVKYPCKHPILDKEGLYDEVISTIFLGEDNQKSTNTKYHGYSSWDVIMHEYGHHMQYHFGTNASFGGTHIYNHNLLM